MNKNKSYRSVTDLLLQGSKGENKSISSGVGYPTNRKRKSEGKKGRTVKIRTVKKPQMKQYGDKGYRPSDGTGVGY